MAECKICNKRIGFSDGSNTVADGVICDECLAKALGNVPVRSLYNYAKQIKEFEKMTAEEVMAVSRKKEEAASIKEELLNKKTDIVVTTMDLHRDYEIIGPVYIQINNRSNMFSSLRTKYSNLLENIKSSGQGSNDKISGLEIMQVLFVNTGTYNGHANFDDAFFIAVEELKERAALLGADAVIGMRQDIDLDSNGFQYFYLQMYGTAVKFK